MDSELLLLRCKEHDNNLSTIHFVGTEPTLYEKLPYLIKELKAMEKKVLVTTNGINLKNMLLPMLEAKLDMLLISLDGPADIHDEIRGRKGLFDSIMTVLSDYSDKLREAKKNGFQVIGCCAITPMNYLYLPEMIEQLAQNEIYDVWCTHMNYVDLDIAQSHSAYHEDFCMGESCIHEEMKPEKVNPWLMYQKITNAKKIADMLKVNFIVAPNVHNTADYIKLYHRPKDIVGQKICQAPFRTMQINADGSTCVMSRCYQMEMGNIKNNTLAECFFSCDIVNLRKRIILEEQWNTCKRCCAIM